MSRMVDALVASVTPGAEWDYATRGRLDAAFGFSPSMEKTAGFGEELQRALTAAIGTLQGKDPNAEITIPGTGTTMRAGHLMALLLGGGGALLGGASGGMGSALIGALLAGGLGWMAIELMQSDTRNQLQVSDDTAKAAIRQIQEQSSQPEVSPSATPEGLTLADKADLGMGNAQVDDAQQLLTMMENADRDPGETLAHTAVAAPVVGAVGAGAGETWSRIQQDRASSPAKAEFARWVYEQALRNELPSEQPFSEANARGVGRRVWDALSGLGPMQIADNSIREQFLAIQREAEAERRRLEALGVTDQDLEDQVRNHVEDRFQLTPANLDEATANTVARQVASTMQRDQGELARNLQAGELRGQGSDRLTALLTDDLLNNIFSNDRVNLDDPESVRAALQEVNLDELDGADRQQVTDAEAAANDLAKRRADAEGAQEVIQQFDAQRAAQAGAAAPLSPARQLSGLVDPIAESLAEYNPLNGMSGRADGGRQTADGASITDTIAALAAGRTPTADQRAVLTQSIRGAIDDTTDPVQIAYLEDIIDRTQRLEAEEDSWRVAQAEPDEVTQARQTLNNQPSDDEIAEAAEQLRAAQAARERAAAEIVDRQRNPHLYMTVDQLDALTPEQRAEWVKTTGLDAMTVAEQRPAAGQGNANQRSQGGQKPPRQSTNPQPAAVDVILRNGQVQHAAQSRLQSDRLADPRLQASSNVTRTDPGRFTRRLPGVVGGVAGALGAGGAAYAMSGGRDADNPMDIRFDPNTILAGVPDNQRGAISQLLSQAVQRNARYLTPDTQSRVGQLFRPAE